MAFSYRLECLGKADKGREERDRSGQELHELGEIGHGQHLPSNGGLCPARGLPTARTILSERLTPADQFILLILAELRVWQNRHWMAVR